MVSAQKLSLVYFTARELTLKQGLYFVYFRMFGQRSVRRPGLPTFYLAQMNCALLAPNKPLLDSAHMRFCFLNKPLEFTLEHFDWQRRDASRLWLYNLHYFACLRQTDLRDSVKAKLIDSWIARNPQGARPAWEPYTTSLRIVNWVGYFSQRNVPAKWQESLYEQARWLFANVERHILANHYFENIKALIFAACYFSRLPRKYLREVNRWRRFGHKQLQIQLAEQFLGDGGHYERSPQYHLLMIQNCLEILYIFRHSCAVESTLYHDLTRVIQQGLTLAVKIARPDGRIPLFNDSAFDQTPDLNQLLAFAHTLSVTVPPAQLPVSLTSADDFGIFGVKTADDWLMIDCGEVGPCYQPGHTHCDFLSFELMLRKQMVVVDSGVFEYDDTDTRKLQRSTEAHNTVCVSDLEQSQVWGAFRVARRARKKFASIRQGRRAISFHGAFEGFFHDGKSLEHSRKVDVEFDGRLRMSVVRISDLLKTAKPAEVCFNSCLHLHPDINVRRRSEFSFVLGSVSGDLAYIIVENAAKVDLQPWHYSPEFGIKQKTQKIVMQGSGNRINYRIHLTDIAL